MQGQNPSDHMFLGSGVSHKDSVARLPLGLIDAKMKTINIYKSSAAN